MTQLTLQISEQKRDWIDAVYPGVLSALWNMGEFTTDNLHARVFREPDSPAWWGSLMAKLKADGHIEYVRHQPSTRPEANGRKVSVWKRKINPQANERAEQSGTARQE